MTFSERNNLLYSGDYIGRVRIAFCDWLEYWAVTETSSIQDEELREMTETMIKESLSNLETYVTKLAALAISEPAVKDAVEVTDENVSTAVINLLASALPFLI